MRSTIEDVARLANVSTATVSRYTSGQADLIAESTQERLRRAIDQLGYVPNAAARTLKTGRTGLIGVILADVSHVYWSAMLGGIEAGSREMGFDVLICSAHNSAAAQHAYLETLLSRGVDGILFNPAPGASGSHGIWNHLRTPVIQLDRGLPDLPYPIVAVDNALGARIATQHLLQHGHRRIGIVSWPVAGLTNREERLSGFLETLRDAGVEPAAHHLIEVDEGEDQIVRCIDELIARPDPPTALFCTNSELTIQTLLALRERGVDVPGSLSLVGFDDPKWAPLVQPPLTAIATPPFRLGKLAALRVCRAIVHKSTLRSGFSRLAPALRDRESVCSPRASERIERSAVLAWTAPNGQAEHPSRPSPRTLAGERAIS
jgi:LacI family transcriptional regulator, kdg operon repressor